MPDGWEHLPWDWAIIPWVSLIPWLLATRARSLTLALVCSWLFGFSFYTRGLLWGLSASAEQFALPSPMNWLLALVLPAWMALFPALATLVTRSVIHHNHGLWPWIAAASWGIGELLRLNILGGVPWLELGITQVDFASAELIPVVGALGTGMVIVLVNALLVQLLFRPVLSTATLFLAASAGGYLWLSANPATVEQGETLDVVMVQGGTSAHPGNEVPTTGQLRRFYVQPTRSILQVAQGADLVLWPETSIGPWGSRPKAALSPIRSELEKMGGALVVGGQQKDLSGDHRYNSAFVLEGDSTQSYRKVHLFPFVESPGLALPDAWLPAMLRERATYRAGESRMPRQIGEHTIGLSICWEGLFSRHAVTQVQNGAALLANISNEHWGFGPGGYEHNALTLRARSAETARALVRSTTTGLTLSTDTRGHILTVLPTDERGYLVETVPLNHHLTPFTAAGGNSAWGIALPLLLLGVWFAAPGRIRRNFKENSGTSVAASYD